MKLSRRQKEKLLQSANQVYFSYLALDFFKSKALAIQHESHIARTLSSSSSYAHSAVFSEESETLLSFAARSIASMSSRQHEMEETITVAGETYRLNIHRALGTNNRYVVTLRDQFDVLDVNKVPNDYTDAESSHILTNKSFMLEVPRNGDIAVSLALDHAHVIGGAKKIDLYRTHLVTLSNIIHKITTEDDISSLLVALATGSGKTYVQALLFAMLSLAEFNAVFALPDKLISQLKKDWKRILPDAFIDRIVTMRDRDDPTQAVEAMQRLRTSHGNMMIASSELLLDQHYDSLLAAAPNQTCLIFDEQHLLMANERRRLRLLTLAQRFLSVFLTATPNQETYKISGAKPVAIMSSGQKQKAGQGQFPETQSIQCEYISDLHRKKEVRFGSREYLQKQFERFIFRFDEAIQPECSSAIRAVFDELPYVVKRKESEPDLRWRLQVPMASKILCIVDDNEALVNCCHALQADDYNGNAHNVYHNGNFVERGSISSFFGIPDVDRSTIANHKYNKNALYAEQLRPDERPILAYTPNNSLKKQLQSNMFHYLVEYVLSDLTGKSMIEHNRVRKESAEGFRDSIVNQYQYRDQSYYYQKLIQEIDEDGARTISPLLAGISSSLHSAIREPRHADITALTNNWFLEDTMHCVTGSVSSFQWRFEEYAKRYLVMGLMSGMEESETPVRDSKPFLGLIEERYSLNDGASGIQTARAKQRQRTSIELLDDQARESSFTPNYTPITEEMADTYFRLGFVGMYVSNKKTEGFNDPNLHTIINAAEHGHDANNSPVSLIQSIGRARGLDDTMLPHYFHGLGHHQASSFDLQALAEDDYYPELFAAQKRFEKDYIAVLGEQVGQDIISWYHQHQEGDETIDADQLKRKVLYLVADALRRLNIQSTHRIHLSRAILPKVIAYAMAKLNKEIEHTKRPYRLSLFVRVVGTMINFICECYFTILRIKPWIAMLWHAWTLARGPQQRTPQSESVQITPEEARALRTTLADAIYLKIIRQAHFKDLTAQGLIAVEFKAWLVRKASVTKRIVEKSVLSYLKPEIKAQVEKHLRSTVFPLFEKMVIPAKAARVREKLQQFNGLLFFLQEHGETIQTLQNDRTDAEFADLMLGLLHKVPGLEVLRASDIVNYPRRVAQHLEWSQQSPFTMIAATPELKELVVTAVTEFLSHDLQNHLGAFLTYADKQYIVEILQYDLTRVRAFAVEYLDWVIANPDNAQDFTHFFTRFQDFFHCTEIKLLPEKAAQMQAKLKDYQRMCIADVMRRELLPCLVNFYPIEARAGLLAQITQDNLETLLRTQEETLKKLIAENHPQAIAQFFFTSLCTKVPNQIDLEQEKIRTQTFFANQMSGFNAVSNGARYAVDAIARRMSGSGIGLMAGRVQTLLLSEDCAQTLSLLLPFHHWQVLQLRFKNEPSNLKKLAAKLVPYVESSADLSPELLLQAINEAFVFDPQMQATQDYAASVGKEIGRLVAGEQVVCETPTQTQRLASVVRESCLPLLATYLPTDVMKAQFLARAYDDQLLRNFFIEHFATFKTLTDISPEQQRETVQQYFQCLYPDLTTVEILLDPKAIAEVQAKNCQDRLAHKIKTAFAMSVACKDKLVDFFNPEDGQALLTSLSDPAQAEMIAGALFSAVPNPAIGGISLASVRTAVPSLQDIEFLHVRLKNLETDVKATLSLGQAVFDNVKLADTLMQQIQPILEHAQFRTLLNLYMGSLKENELALIFEARANPEAQAVAKRLLRFKELMNQCDFVTFKQEFMQCPVEEAYEFDHSPLKLVLEDFATLAEEVTQCHCYYQQHNSKGLQDSNTTRPRLYEFLSDTVKDIRIPAFDSFMSHFSRKIFFIQGIRNGLPKAGQVYADSHSNTVRNLERVNNNLLRPLWWSVNTYSFIYRMLEGAKTLFFFLKDWIYKLLDKIKATMHRALGLPLQQAHVRQGVSVDFTESAFETSKSINALEPLTQEQVAERQCPKDVITHVERDISHLPGHRLRLFQTQYARGEEDLDAARMRVYL